MNFLASWMESGTEQEFSQKRINTSVRPNRIQISGAGFGNETLSVNQYGCVNFLSMILLRGAIFQYRHSETSKSSALVGIVHIHNEARTMLSGELIVS